MRAKIQTILIALFVGGLAGYFLHPQKTDGFIASRQDVIFAEPDTFSRVKNTKNALDALSRRAATATIQAVLAYRQLPQSIPAEKQKAATMLDRLIASSEASFLDFQDTDQQSVVAQSLLRVLQEAGRFNRWTEVYLKVLREHPTSAVVFTSAPNAIRFNQEPVQRARIVAALASLRALPLSRADEEKIQQALNLATPALAKAS